MLCSAWLAIVLATSPVSDTSILPSTRTSTRSARFEETLKSIQSTPRESGPEFIQSVLSNNKLATIQVSAALAAYVVSAAAVLTTFGLSKSLQFILTNQAILLFLTVHWIDALVSILSNKYDSSEAFYEAISTTATTRPGQLIVLSLVTLWEMHFNRIAIAPLLIRNVPELLRSVTIALSLAVPSFTIPMPLATALAHRSMNATNGNTSSNATIESDSLITSVVDILCIPFELYIVFSLLFDKSLVSKFLMYLLVAYVLNRVRDARNDVLTLTAFVQEHKDLFSSVVLRSRKKSDEDDFEESFDEAFEEED